MFAQLIRQHRQHVQASARWEAMRVRLPARIDPAAGGLTICSVAFRAKTWLDLNHQLMGRLNPEAPQPEWLLFDNNTEHSEMIDPHDSRFRVVRPAGRDIDMGYEHALGIGTLLSKVRTRFLLIQDPDCFIVRPDWIRDVTGYMDRHGLGFFGTPINPRRHNSYRYFPYMVCMFVDLSRVPPGDLDFIPDVWRLRTALTYRARRALAGIPKGGLLFRWLLTEQWKTNGWRIKAKYGRGDVVKFESAQPVWDVSQATPPGIRRWIHRLTPAPVAPIPKQAGYCTPFGFAQAGAPDLGALGWEEFMWRSEPFAFHVGSAHAKAATHYAGPLAEVLDAFASRTPDTAASRSASR